MDNKTLGAILGGFGLVIIVIAVGFGVLVYSSNNEDPAPAPTVTAPAPEPSTPTVDPDQFVFDILEEVWNKQSYQDQQNMCMLFNAYPDQAWESFDSPQNEYLTKDQFMEFFSGKCSTI
jgi:hypothetical protein